MNHFNIFDSMSYKIILTIGILLSFQGNIVLSQIETDFDAFSGSEFLLNPSCSELKIVGADNAAYYATYIKTGMFNSFIHLQKFKRNLRLDKDIELKFKGKHKKQHVLGVCSFKNKLTVLSLVKNDNGMMKLFISSLNKNSLESNDDFKEIANFDKRNYYQYNFRLIPFENSLLVTFYLAEQYKLFDHGFVLVTPELEPKYEQSFKNLYKGEIAFQPLEFDCSDNGDVFVFGKRPLIEKNPNLKMGLTIFSKIKKCAFAVAKFNTRGELNFVQDITFSDYELDSYSFKLIDNQTIISSGFCHKKNEQVSKGSWRNNTKRETRKFKEIGSKNLTNFFFQIDVLTGEVVSKKLNELSTTRKANTSEDLSSKYVAGKASISPEGNVYLTCEKKYYSYVDNTSVDHKGNTQGSFSSTLKSVHILIFNVNSEGEIVGLDKIDRVAVINTKIKNYASLLPVIDSSSVHYVFLDHPKNIGLNAEDTVYSTFSGKEVSLVSCDSKDEYKKMKLKDFSINGYLPFLGLTTYEFDNEILFFFKNRYNYKLGKLKRNI